MIVVSRTLQISLMNLLMTPLILALDDIYFSIVVHDSFLITT